MPDLIFYIGILAGTLTTIANLPQFIKAWRTKSTKDISRGFLLVLGTGVLVWIVYGLMLNEIPIIIANVLTFLIVLGIAFLKLKYG
ncbi:MAG: SemiSWEET transporter [Candidatus Diapherotrites archaeon]